MLLRGRQGTELGLTIVGYQFPNELVDPWDSNTLLVEVRILAPEGSWDVVDPCLTTWEADHLVQWFATLGRRPDVLGGRLNEPNVAFTARLAADRNPDADRFSIAATFSLELRPPWLGSGNLTVEVDVDRRQLAAAANSLRADLDRFPQRGDDPTL